MSTAAAATAADRERRAREQRDKERKKQGKPTRPGKPPAQRAAVLPAPPAPPAVAVPDNQDDPEGQERIHQPTGAVTSMQDTIKFYVEKQKKSSRLTYNPNTATRFERFLHWWVIDPRTSRVLGYWDVTTMIALTFVAIVTPFEVAFLDSPQSWEDIVIRMSSVGWLFIVNRILDAIFVTDLVLQFRLMYTENSSIQGTRWVDDPSLIVKNYVTGWFTLDLMSILVVIFDITPLEGGNESVRDLRVLRVMRVLRLIKLIRLMRASRVFKRWEMKMAINYSRLALFKSLLNVAILSHWFACIWGLQVSLTDKSGSWVESFGYCEEAAPDVAATGITASGVAVGSDGFSCPGGPWALYSASVYWAVMTITSIGYGDIHATDRNISEQVVNTMLMLIGGMLWGHVIGTFCGVVANMAPHTNEFNRRMDDLNRYVQMHGLPHELRRRLREYMHQTKHLQIASASKDLISLLSPALQGEVVWLVHKPWLSRVQFFKDAEPEFLVQIALALSPLVFTPGELAVNGFLYIVHRGIALYGGRVLVSGRVWGEDCIIQSPHLQKRWCARAMNYLEVYMISRDELLDIANTFPKTFEIIRKAAVRMAVRRQFILAAKLMTGGAFGKRLDGQGSTFDRILDQATAVPLSELKLQASLTVQRHQEGKNDVGMAVFEDPATYCGALGSAPAESSSEASESINAVRDNAAHQTRTSPQMRALKRANTSAAIASLCSPPSATSGTDVRRDVKEALGTITSMFSQEKGKASEEKSQMSSDVSALRTELMNAVEKTRTELGGRLDDISKGLAALQASLADFTRQQQGSLT